MVKNPTKKGRFMVKNPTWLKSDLSSAFCGSTLNGFDWIVIVEGAVNLAEAVFLAVFEKQKKVLSI